jgi:hypothetical protein
MLKCYISLPGFDHDTPWHIRDGEAPGPTELRLLQVIARLITRLDAFHWCIESWAAGNRNCSPALSMVKCRNVSERLVVARRRAARCTPHSWANAGRAS